MVAYIYIQRLNQNQRCGGRPVKYLNVRLLVNVRIYGCDLKNVHLSTCCYHFRLIQNKLINVILKSYFLYDHASKWLITNSNILAYSFVMFPWKCINISSYLQIASYTPYLWQSLASEWSFGCSTGSEISQYTETRDRNQGFMSEFIIHSGIECLVRATKEN